MDYQALNHEHIPKTILKIVKSSSATCKTLEKKKVEACFNMDKEHYIDTWRYTGRVTNNDYVIEHSFVPAKGHQLNEGMATK